MDEKIIRSVALFFYLNLFDSRQAFSASQKTLASWKDHGGVNKSTLIPIARKILNRTTSFRGFGPQGPSGDFNPPMELNIQPWREFKKRADSAEFETVLWSQVLGFSDSDVAQGFGVTEGTVRHRVNRGLRALGKLV